MFNQSVRTLGYELKNQEMVLPFLAVEGNVSLIHVPRPVWCLHTVAPNTVELHLSGLTGTASHRDMQKIRIIGFFFENRLHWQFAGQLLLRGLEL